MITRKTAIDAIKWMFGMNGTEARKYLNEVSLNSDIVREIVIGYLDNAKKAFYND